MADPGQGYKAEAICFTAGPKGAAFGVGVIHAWLASGRSHPLVAAGISTGALTAAAMQRCYRELAGAHAGPSREAARWTWFRSYLRTISVNPLKTIWRAFPSPVDFASDQPPVQDLSCPRDLAKEEAQARRHYFILTEFGVWMARLPVRFRSLASLLVHWVRKKERYGGPLNLASLTGAGVRIVAGLWWNLLCHPSFYSESTFSYSDPASGQKRYPTDKRFPHPLFGWRVWLTAIFIGLALLLVPASLFALIMGQWRALFLENPIGVRVFAFFVAGGAVLLLAVLGVMASENARGRILLVLSKHFFSELDLSRNLLNPYHFQLQLKQLFGDGRIDEDPIDPAGFGFAPASAAALLQKRRKPGRAVAGSDGDSWNLSARAR